MVTIGVELNHVVRNINKQIVKCYAKEFNKLELDYNEIDPNVDVFENYAKFEDSHDKGKFIYVDYPYEIFACADTMEKKLATKITTWLSEVTNYEDEEIRIVFYGMDEDALSIQSSFFFLSKIGCRSRMVFFPTSVDEVWKECDAIITARNEFFEKGIPQGKKVVLINKEFNKSHKDEAFLNYDGLGAVIEDNDFFNKITK